MATINGEDKRPKEERENEEREKENETNVFFSLIIKKVKKNIFLIKNRCHISFLSFVNEKTDRGTKNATKYKPQESNWWV